MVPSCPSPAMKLSETMLEGNHSLKQLVFVDLIVKHQSSLSEQRSNVCAREDKCVAADKLPVKHISVSSELNN